MTEINTQPFTINWVGSTGSLIRSWKKAYGYRYYMSDGWIKKYRYKGWTEDYCA